jgi:transglutaminase-like putative cysteine protease
VIRLGLLAAVLLSVGVLGVVAVRLGRYHAAYRALFYTVVSQRAARSATSPAEVVRDLNDFVYLNVRTPEDAPVLDDTAADTLIRGFSYCDSAVLLFTRLLQEQNIPSRMTFLSPAQDAPSPHTIAEVFVDGAWRVFDTYYDFVPRLPDGSVATIADLVAHPELLTPSRSAVEWYRAAYPVVEADLAPQPWRSLQMLARGVVARIPDGLIDRLQDLYLDLPPPTYTIKSDAPAVLTFTSADARLYFRARNYHVFLRTADAASAYTALVRDYPGSPYAAAARYQLGQLDLTQAHDPATAAQRLRSLLEEHPHTAWRSDATYLEARAYDAIGACSTARDLYAAVAHTDSNGLEDARARLGALACA